MKVFMRFFILAFIVFLSACADINGMHGYAAQYGRCIEEGTPSSCYVVASTDRVFSRRTPEQALTFFDDRCRGVECQKLRDILSKP